MQKFITTDKISQRNKSKQSVDAHNFGNILIAWC